VTQYKVSVLVEVPDVDQIEIVNASGQKVIGPLHATSQDVLTSIVNTLPNGIFPDPSSDAGIVVEYLEMDIKRWSK
jgi:hypothetical protein